MALNVDPKFDFRGYATKYNLKCSDGRTIQPGAFKHSDGRRIPLVWQHMHNDPSNVLGYAILEHREDGVYAFGYFNNSPAGIQAKTIVEHGDVGSMSIFANKLVEKNNLVHSGEIRELSLVLSGANPGAVIEHVSISHNDGTIDESEEEAIVSMLLPIELYQVEKEENVMAQADTKSTADVTVGDVVESMTDDQKKVMYALIAQAMEGAGEDLKQSEKGETFMKKNVFENDEETGGKTLSHADRVELANAMFNDMKAGATFKDAFLAHAGTYGIDNIGYLFPDAKLLDNEPSFETRRMGWVAGWMSGTRHIPFSRIKKVWADLTPEAARAKGYITGNEKIEQVFALLKRTTEPTTIYKKQKLDRDDIVDITDFDVVAWMWREMRFMLNEEVARAGLVGDGRVFGTDDDAIDPAKIRPVYGDVSPFVYYLTLEATVTDYLDIIDAILNARVQYKGKGTPTLYTTNAVLNGMLLLRDTTDRRLYKSVAELASELRVADIVEVDVMEGVTREWELGSDAALLGIMVNPADYTYGSDKGGAISTFDQFDIDFNQQKYLIETRLSGSLLEPKSAIVIERKVVGG
jgi:HK97 family phage prohead protease